MEEFAGEGVLKCAGDAVVNGNFEKRGGGFHGFVSGEHGGSVFWGQVWDTIDVLFGADNRGGVGDGPGGAGGTEPNSKDNPRRDPSTKQRNNGRIAKVFKL